MSVLLMWQHATEQELLKYITYGIIMLLHLAGTWSLVG